MVCCVASWATHLWAEPLPYRQALDRIKNGQFPFEELAQWEDHLLYPHLVTHWVEHHPDAVDPTWLQPLLSRDDFTAAAWYTRQRWLNELARRNAWEDYLAFAEANELAPSACLQFVAQESLGDAIDIKALRSLWLTGYSLPKECDPYLARLKDQPDFDDLVWQRQLLAFKNRSGGLMSYLGGLYKTAEYRLRGERLSAVYADPGALLKASYQPSEAWQRELAIATIDRMAYLTPERASNLWVQLIQATPDFSSEHIRSVSAHLGVAMAKLALPPADYWLSIADPKRENEELQHWRLQIALANSDWSKVLELNKALSAKLKDNGQWRYWSAMALSQSGQVDAADAILAPLAGERSYYGFLAAEALNRPIALAPDEFDIIDPSQSKLLENPGFQRAKALFEAGDIVRAQLEWNLTGRDLSREEWLEAAQVALSWNWYHKASQAASWSGRYGALDLRYPTPWLEQVTVLEQSHQVPRHWIYGVIRQESHFMTDAESPAGAFGLMQLMPYTARQIAKDHQLAYNGDWDLTNPDLNLELGTRYLALMRERFGHPVYATAAYNAGPSRVDRWLERYPGDLRIWIESIPFDETRNYVKSVLAYTQVYAARDEASDWRMAQWLEPAQVALGE